MIRFRGDKPGSRKDMVFPMKEWMALKEGDYVRSRNGKSRRRCVSGTENGLVYLERNVGIGKRIGGIRPEGPVIYFPSSRDQLRPDK